MSVLRAALAVTTLLALAACGQTIGGATTMPAPKTAEQVLFETKTGVDLAILQADAYATLPRCGPGVSPVCSTSATAKRLYTLSKTAVDTVDAGRPVVAAVAATQNPSTSDQQKAQEVADAAAAALQRLVGAIAVLPKKGEL